MAGPLVLGITAEEAAAYLALGAVSHVGTLAVDAVFDDDEIAPALEVINNTLNRIDQAIVEGFTGRDIELTRLDAALAIANGRFDATREQIGRIEPFQDTQKREGVDLPPS